MSGAKRKQGTRKMRESIEKASGKVLNQAMRKTAFDLFSAVIFSTPVKTGRAKGSWGLGLNRTAPGPHNRADPTGAATVAEVTAGLASYEPGDRITLSSNLPYIVPLNNGSSKQAPFGMVDANVIRFKPIVTEVAREIRRRGR